MKQRIVDLLKYNRVVYITYYYVVSFFINIMNLFIKTDDKLIIFNSFAGRKYDDSPKVVFELMRKDPRFKEYKLVWAFHEPEKFNIEGAEKIKTDCFKYFLTILKARVWITNSSFERGLHIKGKNTLYVNTWHGSPIKKMGSDLATYNQSFRPKGKNIIDVFNAQSVHDIDIYSKCFGIPRERFIKFGLPRNDELVDYTEQRRNDLKKRLNITEDKRVILYCPTFREYEKDKDLSVVLTPPMNLIKWEKELGEEYILLFRAHYEVSKVMDIKENEFVRNVTNYPSLNDLMIVSDILISDYSSVFIDFSVMDKCMIHFTYDFDKYNEKRGMYFDLRQYLSGADNEDDVIKMIKSLSYEEEVEKTRMFREKYVEFYGNAGQKTVNYIAERIL